MEGPPSRERELPLRTSFVGHSDIAVVPRRVGIALFCFQKTIIILYPSIIISLLSCALKYI